MNESSSLRYSLRFKIIKNHLSYLTMFLTPLRLAIRKGTFLKARELPLIQISKWRNITITGETFRMTSHSISSTW
jgi:hypothetical protein